VLKGVVHF